jgi:hypothetical protein
MYRSPGTHQMPGKDSPTYSYVGVTSEAEETAALERGYVHDRDVAIGRKAAEPDPEVIADKAIEAAADLREAIQEVRGESRDALEAKAKDLGVSFNWKTSDTVLAERIAAKDEE